MSPRITRHQGALRLNLTPPTSIEVGVGAPLVVVPKPGRLPRRTFQVRTGEVFPTGYTQFCTFSWPVSALGNQVQLQRWPQPYRMPQ